MEFGYKIWIEKNGNNVFGVGIYSLLSLVEETGSLHKAAQNLKMSYRAAWGKVRDYEDRMGTSLLEKGRHGRTGAHLTPEGKLVLFHFKHIMEEMDKLIESSPIVDLIEKIDKLESSK